MTFTYDPIHDSDLGLWIFFTKDGVGVEGLIQAENKLDK